MQTTLKQRIEELMRDVKIDNPNEFATYIGMDRAQLIYDILKGDVKNSPTVTQFISKKFQRLNPDWINKGIEPKELGGNETKKPDQLISQADFDKVVQENKELKDKLLQLSLRLNDALDKK